MLAVLFDHAELKGGQVVQIRSVIQGVAPVKPMAAPDMAGPGYGSMGGGGGMSGTQRGGMGTGSGGGLSDGGTGMGRAGTTSMGGGGVLGGNPQPTGRNNDPSLSGAGGIGGTGSGIGNAGGIGTAGGIGNAGGIDSTDPNSSPTPLNSNIGNLPMGGVSSSRPVVAAGESVSTAPRTTALPGVLLSTTATANASGTLIAPGRNISLTSGTVITLGVITR